MGQTRELTERQAALVLNALPGVGPVRVNQLLGALGGDPRKVLEAGPARLGEIGGLGPAARTAVLNWRRHFDPGQEEEGLARVGADYLVPADSAYPELLREIPDRPPALYRRGGYDFGHPCIAIVGSRRATSYGCAMARRLAADMVRSGFCVVSGLARGIDTAAHEGALDAGGVTVAVLGTGPDIVYPPENARLARRILEKGALLSEFPLGRPPEKWSFPMRNRIVSGMSAVVIVVESGVDGGAMITARFAGEQGRTVFAVPGRLDQPTSAGCHRLIRDGASLLTEAADIFAELDYLDGLRPAAIAPKGSPRRQPPGLTGEEKAVLGAFRGGSVLDADALAELTGLGAAPLAAALMMLEIRALLARRADGSYEAA